MAMPIRNNTLLLSIDHSFGPLVLRDWLPLGQQTHVRIGEDSVGDWSGPTEEHKIKKQFDGDFGTAQVSADNSMVLGGGKSLVASLFHIDHQLQVDFPHADVSRVGTRQPWSSGGAYKAIEAVAISPDATQVVTGGTNHVGVLWSWRSSSASTKSDWSSAKPEVISLLFGHDSTVKFAEFSPDGRYFVTLSDPGTAFIWAVENELYPKPRLVLKMPERAASVITTYLNRAAFAKDNAAIVVDSALGPYIWDIDHYLKTGSAGKTTELMWDRGGHASVWNHGGILGWEQEQHFQVSSQMFPDLSFFCSFICSISIGPYTVFFG